MMLSYIHICKKKDNLDGKRITGRTKEHTVDIYIYAPPPTSLHRNVSFFFFKKKITLYTKKINIDI